MKRIVWYPNDIGGTSISTPIYLSQGGERTRKLQPGIIGFKKTKTGWVVGYRVQEKAFEETNLTVSEMDILFPDGTSIFAETADEYLARIVELRVANGDIPPSVQWHILDDDDPESAAFIAEHFAPSNPDFRNAVEVDATGKCFCHMGKARDIHMDAIRTERNKELAAKDITFMRAVEAGDTDAQATIATEKQTLRDLPATFDITTDVDTPEKLKAKWPAELPTRE